MKYRRLGKTGLDVSVIGLGTWQLGGEWGKTFSSLEVEKILDTAREMGVSLIDTAECYGDHQSEEILGKAVRGKWDGWVLASKFGHLYQGSFEREQCWSADEVQQQLEKSLRSLQAETIDLYQFHSGSNQVFDNDRLWTMLEKQKKAGKIRHLGISITSGNSEYQEHQTDSAGRVGAEAIQVYYNRLDRRSEEKVFPSCLRQDLGVLARVPLASGFLSGKFSGATRFASNDVRSQKTPEELSRIIAQVEEVRREIPEGQSMTQFALAWCLQHPAVSCVIPGCRNPEQLRQNAQAADLDQVSSEHPLNVV